MSHRCHAINCTMLVHPKLLMCPGHWRRVPKHLRDAVWANYVPGQERTKTPTPAYTKAANAAIHWIQAEEGRLAQWGRHR